MKLPSYSNRASPLTKARFERFIEASKQPPGPLRLLEHRHVLDRLGITPPCEIAPGVIVDAYEHLPESDLSGERLPAGILRAARRICGCGRPEEAWHYLHCVLRHAAIPHEVRPRGNSPLEPTACDGWFALYMVDGLGLIEHGCTICGSWLTDDGEVALAFLDIYGHEWDTKPIHNWVDDDGCHYT